MVEPNALASKTLCFMPCEQVSSIGTASATATLKFTNSNTVTSTLFSGISKTSSSSWDATAMGTYSTGLTVTSPISDTATAEWRHHVMALIDFCADNRRPKGNMATFYIVGVAVGKLIFQLASLTGEVIHSTMCRKLHL
ncbi:hypothetical protein DFH27DRAFT_616953 [Peziza echinospora]|nr:hypothetical protein DFH27DRAFT_616953 [Peziza echinospora]